MELLREDAPDRSGQGLRLMVLITTNEPFDQLHAAVKRPGRCLSNLEFGWLPAEQASAWLRSHHPQAAPVAEPTSLAQLFERLPAAQRPRPEAMSAEYDENAAP